MNKSIIGVALLVTLTVAGIFIYKTADKNLKVSVVSEYLDANSKNQNFAKEKIINHILDSTEVKDFINTIEYARLSVEFDRTSDGNEDAIFVLHSGYGSTLVAVYRKHNTNYTYLGLVDTFMKVSQVQPMALKGKTENLILVREHVKQTGDAMEEGVYVRAYIWDRSRFQQVLSIIESYNSMTNKVMEDNEGESVKRWQRLVAKGKVDWQSEIYPIVKIHEAQNYSLSKDANIGYIPKDERFELIKSREFDSVFHWSPKWNHFILFEGADSKNDKAIAVIEDLSVSPFSLMDEFNESNMKYVVKYKNGAVKILPKSQIRMETK